MTDESTKRTLRFIHIPEKVAEEARRTRIDAFGHHLKSYQGRESCRVCLNISREPEDFLLLSYRPLPDRNPYAEVGPIFIHERECTPYGSLDEFPEDFRSRALVLRAYDGDGEIVDATVAAAGEGERAAANFLDNPTVEEVHVRHPTYTCFDFKVVRG
jgi:hypothetical protein